MLNGMRCLASHVFAPKIPQENTGVSGDTLYKMAMAYDGSGRRISKTRWVKARGDANWSRVHVTHYTGIGTEVRENLATAQPETQVVVNMPQGLGRYGIESAGNPATGARTFEWYLKNHLGSTMLVYGTGGTSGGLKAAYDYRSFGEQIELTSPSTGKVTENFTGKEKDDETELNYFGARYLDPMLGMWTSVDPARQFASPYLYAGNGVNPVNGVDPDGMYYEDGERCTEGKYVPSDYQGTVSPAELDELAAVEREFMASPGIEQMVMSMAKFTKENGVETRFWYNKNGQNSFAYGTEYSVKPETGTGSYIHFHTWRTIKPKKDLNSRNEWFRGEGLSKEDENWSTFHGKSIMGMELRSGNIYYTSPSMPFDYLIMRFPAGYIEDANAYEGKIHYAP